MKIRLGQHRLKLLFKHRFNEPSLSHFACLLRILGFLGIVVFSAHALADPSAGSDLLAGTDSGAWATLEGTGKKYLYMTEGLIGLAAYIKTKNLLALAGIVVVAVFINIIIKIGAGQ